MYKKYCFDFSYSFQGENISLKKGFFEFNLKEDEIRFITLRQQKTINLYTHFMSFSLLLLLAIVYQVVPLTFCMLFVASLIVLVGFNGQKKQYYLFIITKEKSIHLAIESTEIADVKACITYINNRMLLE